MKKLCLLLGLLVLPQIALAAGLNASESECLSRIRDEVDFIVSRLNLIHRSYEKQVSDSALGQFKSGGYSTVTMLDNTIRKYHDRLVRRIRKYPFQYKSRLKSVHLTGSRRCLAERLRAESVGTIHEFELSWQKALRQAQDNAVYFRRMDHIH